jgi:hypothetical protein
MLTKFLLALRISIWTVSARQALALGNSRKAAALMDRVYSALGERPALIEFDLLRSMISIGVRDAPLALACAERALSLLDSGAERYRAADRAYLNVYAKSLVVYCHSWLSGTDYRHEPNGNLDLGQVSRHLKLNFPMTSDGRFASSRTLH